MPLNTGKKYEIEVRRYLRRCNHFTGRDCYEVVDLIRRVLRSEQIGNFNPFFCTYKGDRRMLVNSNEGDVSDPFRRKEKYAASFFIEVKFCALPEDELDPEVIEDVCALARKAVRDDSWMMPSATPDEIGLSWTEWSERQEEWKQTDHYQLFYGQEMRNYAGKERDRIDRDNSELEQEFAAELEDAFFEEWSRGHNLYEFWKSKISREAQ